MRRRHFLSILSGALVELPASLHAQQVVTPIIGFLSGRSPRESSSASEAFRDALRKAGYVEGQNIAIEYRWADGQPDRLPKLAADLAERGVAVIFAAGGSESARAAAAATAKIPIVFTSATDPVKTGLVSSLNRPGGNITGVSLIGASLEPKRLGILHQLVPQAGLIGVILNTQYPGAEAEEHGLREGAADLRQEIQIENASDERDLEIAFTKLVQSHAGALLVATDVFFLNRRARIIALAWQHRLPAIYGFREFALEGGLISYGASISNAYSQAGSYVARILRGDKPADLPILQPTKFELFINLKTAKALAVDVPPTLLAIADEVIE